MTEVIELLRHCPLLTELSLHPNTTYGDIRDVDWFLQAFVEDGNQGVICPRLQEFNFSGNIRFSLATLRKFLEEKEGNFLELGILPWRKVVIDMYIKGSGERSQQISDFVSQKRQEGLDIYVYIYSL